MKHKKRGALNCSPENQSLLMRRRAVLLKRSTEAETHIEAILKQLGERYMPQKGFFTPYRFFVVDFYLPKRGKLCLEIDGDYHKRQPAYDRARDCFLKERRGFRVVRLTNAEAMALTIETIGAVISAPQKD